MVSYLSRIKKLSHFFDSFGLTCKPESAILNVYNGKGVEA